MVNVELKEKKSNFASSIKKTKIIYYANKN
jgi:hypothetical protein